MTAMARNDSRLRLKQALCALMINALLLIQQGSLFQALALSVVAAPEAVSGPGSIGAVGVGLGAASSISGAHLAPAGMVLNLSQTTLAAVPTVIPQILPQAPVEPAAMVMSAEPASAVSAKAATAVSLTRISESLQPDIHTLADRNVQGEKAQGLGDSVMDKAMGLRPQGLPSLPDPSGALTYDLAYVKQLRAVLGSGQTAAKETTPFVFRTASGGLFSARDAGLEGFLYSKLELQGDGQGLDLGHVDDYFPYLDDLLAAAQWAGPLRRDLESIRLAQVSPAEKNRRLDERLTAAVKEYQGEIQAADPSGWFRQSGVYMILARAYNRLQPGRSFFDSLDDAELQRIKGTTHADAVWLLDIFEIGEIHRWGTVGGSPYSIKGYKIKPELGGEEAFKRFVQRAHAMGLKVGADEIPNHVSLDSDLVKTYPEALIHIVPPQNLSKEEMLAQAPPYFYYLETDRYPEDGQRVHKKILIHYPRTGYGDGTWQDMAQRDYSQPVAREWEVEQARRMVADLGIDVLRRDMAYYITNAYYYDTWLGYLGQERDRTQGWAREAMGRFIEGFKARRDALKGQEVLEDATYTSKEAKPSSAMFDEAYGYETDLSRAGSNGVYNKNDHDEALGQIGLYESLMSRDAGRIREALKNVAFRSWQRGGSTLVNFIGTHDGGEGNPIDKFGRFLKATALAALLLRPILMYNGLEQGVGQAANLLGDLANSQDREKAIPFDIPVGINWQNVDPANQEFLKLVFAKSAEYKGLFARGSMDVLKPMIETPVVAYTVSAPSGQGRRTVLAVMNFGDGRADGRFRFPATLAAFGAFVPDASKNYILRDVANKGSDGQPAVYARSGKELAEQGLYIELDGAGVQLFEVEEIPASAQPALGQAVKAAGDALIGH
jgi:hypothetical protein